MALLQPVHCIHVYMYIHTCSKTEGCTCVFNFTTGSFCNESLGTYHMCLYTCIYIHVHIPFTYMHACTKALSFQLEGPLPTHFFVALLDYFEVYMWKHRILHVYLDVGSMCFGLTRAMPKPHVPRCLWTPCCQCFWGTRFEPRIHPCRKALVIESSTGCFYRLGVGVAKTRALPFWGLK